MPLTDTAAKQAKPKDKTYKLSDERGMFLQVTPKGQKYWRLKYRYAGKEKLLALGVYPEISLKEARELRDKARALIRQNIDPVAERHAQKAHREFEGKNNFATVAMHWLEKEQPHWSESHAKRVKRAIEKDLIPTLGNKSIATITPPELLKTLRKIESRGAIETAHRAKQIAGKIFRYGVATGLCERDITHDISDALAKPIKTHLAAITDPKEVSKLLVAIDNYEGTPIVKAALQISPLLLSRPGEIRHMEWSEINWEEKRWEIPASKMKLKQPHIVPLSKQALDILLRLRPLTGNGRYIFPSARSTSRPLSDNGTRTALRTLGFDNDTMTPHGFRAMGRTILDEVLGYRIDWIEHQLAHAVKDTNGRAYNRTSHLPQRAKMLQHWANYLDELKTEILSSNIVIDAFKRGNINVNNP